jgi:predicted signal transduction protein with EAL and GGDEF domain
VEADDLGEAAVEEDDPATAKRFVALSAPIDRRFDDLQTLASQQEHELAAEAALGLRVTAEGIETPSQLSSLIELNCNHGQGFLLGRPAPQTSWRPCSGPPVPPS